MQNVLGGRFGEQVCRIGALGQQLWRTALGHSIGEQRRGTALGSSFGQLSGPALRQLRGAALGNNCGEQLCGFAAALTNNCLEERQLWGVAFEGNFGKLLS